MERRQAVQAHLSASSVSRRPMTTDAAHPASALTEQSVLMRWFDLSLASTSLAIEHAAAKAGYGLLLCHKKLPLPGPCFVGGARGG